MLRLSPRDRRSMLGAAILSVLALCLGIVPLARAQEIKEPSTGVGFPIVRSWGKYKMKCLGTALREKYSFDVYAGCFYVDMALGKQKLLEFLSSPKGKDAYQDGKLDKSKLLAKSDFFRWLISSDLPISIDMTFVRNVSAEKIRETYQEGLSIYLKDQALINRFTSLSQGEIKKWQHLTLNLMPGGKVTFQFAGKTNPPITSKPLARALLSIYFGRKPINDKIKRGLVQHIEWLLQ